MSPRRIERWLIAATTVVAAVACDSGVTDASDQIVAIQIEPRNLGLFERTEGTFYARAIKHDGPAYRLDPEPVRFASRDTTVLRITPFGVATGVKLGLAWIVATFDAGDRNLTDSIQVPVTRFP